MAEFVFRKGTELITYTNWEYVPTNLDFDHVIKFIPDIPSAPHTGEEHEEMEKWNERLQTLMEIENASSN